MTGKILIPMLLASAAQAGKTWVFEPGQSLVSVEIGRLSATSTQVDGRFRELDDGGVAVEVRLAASSFTTGKADRDRQIQEGEIVVEGRAPKPSADGALRVKGTITIRGVARPIEIPVHLVRAGGMLFVHASFVLDGAHIDVDTGLHQESPPLASQG